MANSAGAKLVVEAVIEHSGKAESQAPADSNDGKSLTHSAESSGEETGVGAKGAGNSAAVSEDQLHRYAGHEHEKYPLYEDRQPLGNYEYLDHTADVQLHSWGSSLKDSFEAVVVAMFDYMTDIKFVEKTITKDVVAEGDDLKSLLYHFLDEWLFVFSTDPFFIPREVTITEFDEENFTIKSTGLGEYFDLVKHPQGTEVKAITYSNMQIHSDDDKHDIYVIIDI